MKRVLSIQSNQEMHWVGDGFPVRTLFSYQTHARLLSPFLLLDYAGPADFAASSKPRGVGEHPHRGFETVTIVYEGEVSHRDSGGGGGTIGPGDVQWMTAGSGVVHEEFHSQQFTQAGGRLKMIQLWVNLPAKYKMVSPAYQAILSAQIPRVSLAGNSGSARIIAGGYLGESGPARTFSPMQVIEFAIEAGKELTLAANDSWNTALVMLSGDIHIDQGRSATEGDLVIFDAKGEDLRLTATSRAQFLFLSGEPIREPVVGYGPFVMNTREEIETAIKDYNSGRFGLLGTPVG